MIGNLCVGLRSKFNNRFGFTLIELMIVLALMSIVVLPAYMLIVNGQRIFARESDYQTMLRDTHAFFEYVNTDVRLNGFNSISLVKKDDYPAKLIEKLSGSGSYGDTALLVKKTNADTYYIRNNDNELMSIKLRGDGSSLSVSMVANVSEFEVNEQKSDDDISMITLSVTLSYEGRDDVVTTNIYKRYEQVAENN